MRFRNEGDVLESLRLSFEQLANFTNKELDGKASLYTRTEIIFGKNNINHIIKSLDDWFKKGHVSANKDSNAFIRAIKIWDVGLRASHTQFEMKTSLLGLASLIYAQRGENSVFKAAAVVSQAVISKCFPELQGIIDTIINKDRCVASIPRIMPG